MDNARLIKISKYLSTHLRHCSARLELTLLHGLPLMDYFRHPGLTIC